MPYILTYRGQQRLAVAGLMTCLIALSAELTVHMADHRARGGNVVGALLSYVSYYTVGSNILLVAVYAAHLSRARALRILRDTRVRTMAAAMITLVMLVYLFILSRVEAPQGLGKISIVGSFVLLVFVIGIWFVAQARIIHFAGLSYLLFVLARKKGFLHLRKGRLIERISFRSVHAVLLVKTS